MTFLSTIEEPLTVNFLTASGVYPFLLVISVQSHTPPSSHRDQRSQCYGITSFQNISAFYCRCAVAAFTHISFFTSCRVLFLLCCHSPCASLFTSSCTYCLDSCLVSASCLVIAMFPESSHLKSRQHLSIEAFMWLLLFSRRLVDIFVPSQAFVSCPSCLLVTSWFGLLPVILSLVMFFFPLVCCCLLVL